MEAGFTKVEDLGSPRSSTQSLTYSNRESSAALALMWTCSILGAKIILTGPNFALTPEGIFIICTFIVPSIAVALVVNRWRITLTDQDVAWRTLGSKGKLRWDEIISVEEVAARELSLKIESKSGRALLPLAGMQNPDQIRKALASRGLLKKVEIPYENISRGRSYNLALMGAITLLYFALLLMSSALRISDHWHIAALCFFTSMHGVFCAETSDRVRITEDHMTMWNWKGQPTTLNFKEVQRAYQDSDSGELTLGNPRQELVLKANIPGFESLKRHILDRLPTGALKR